MKVNESAFDEAFKKAAKSKEPISISRGNNVHKFIKSYEFVKWQSENEKNTCSICRERNGRIYRYTELEGIWPAHKNCMCKVIPVPAVESETMAINILSGIENKYIIGSEGYRKYVLNNGKLYENINGILPSKKGRKFYYININNRTTDFVIVSNDLLCYL